MLWTALILGHALACEGLVGAAVVLEHLGRAETAWTQLDRPGFAVAVGELRDELPCLRDPLTPADAAAIHRVEALDLFLVGDRDAAARAYSAAVLLEPAYQLPLGIAPEGNPLRRVWLEGQALGPGPSRELARPADGALLIDGSRSLRRAELRPVVWQRVDGQGRVVDTAYLAPGEPVPAYRTWTHTGPPQSPAEVPKTREHRPLVAVAAVAGVASGALWALSLQRADTFWDPTTPQEDLDGIRLQTNGLIVGAVGAGAGAAATGLVALWVWQR